MSRSPFAWIGSAIAAPPAPPTCAKGVVLSTSYMVAATPTPAYLPGVGAGASSGSTPTWILVGAAVLGGVVLWHVAKTVTPVLENPVTWPTGPEWKRIVSGAEALQQRLDWQVKQQDPRKSVGMEWAGRSRWARIYRQDSTGSRSALYFVDKITGNYYLAKSWKERASHISGNVKDIAENPLVCTPCGVKDLPRPNPLVGVQTPEELASMHVEDMREHLLDEMHEWLSSPVGPPRPGIALALREGGVSPQDIRDYYDPDEPEMRLGSQEIQERGLDQIRNASHPQIRLYYRKTFGLRTNPGHDIDPEQLAIGIEVEREHTQGMPEPQATRTAEKIAREHFAEDRLYYVKLLAGVEGPLSSIFSPNPRERR